MSLPGPFLSVQHYASYVLTSQDKVLGMVPGWGLSKVHLSQGHVSQGVDATPRIPAVGVGVGVLVDTDASAHPGSPLIPAVWECRMLKKNAKLPAQVFVAKPNHTGPGATPMQITCSRFPGFRSA